MKINKKLKLTPRTRIIVFLAMFLWTPIARSLLRLLDHDQARAAFHSCARPTQKTWRDRFWPIKWSTTWRLIFDQWLRVAKTEGQVKGIFFEASFYAPGRFRPDTDHPLRDVVVEKWLTFLTDWQNDYTLEIVWKLCRNWGRHPLAVTRFKEFIAAMYDEAKGHRVEAIWYVSHWVEEAFLPHEYDLIGWVGCKYDKSYLEK